MTGKFESDVEYLGLRQFKILQESFEELEEDYTEEEKERIKNIFDTWQIFIIYCWCIYRFFWKNGLGGIRI